MEVNQEKFNEIKKEAEEFYKNIKEVYCPYFGENIAFNSKGLDHIKLREWNILRK